MRALLALVPILIVCVCTPAAGAATVTVDGAPGGQPYQSWVDGSLVPAPPGGHVAVYLMPCPIGPDWAAGCTYAPYRLVFLGPDARSRDRFLHEVGHLFDDDVMNLATRRRFKALVGTAAPWYGDATSDPPAEQFAEAYSLCARHRSLNQMYFGMYGYTPSPSVHAQVCALIRAAPAGG
jgi:hypothetical protein